MFLNFCLALFQKNIDLSYLAYTRKRKSSKLVREWSYKNISLNLEFLSTHSKWQGLRVYHCLLERLTKINTFLKKSLFLPLTFLFFLSLNSSLNLSFCFFKLKSSPCLNLKLKFKALIFGFVFWLNSSLNLNFWCWAWI